MSKYTFVCCSMCGRDLYKPFNDFDDDTVRHIEYYTLNTVEGEKEICLQCYEAGLAKEFELKDTTVRYRFSR